MNRTRFIFVLIIIVALLIVGISLVLRANHQKSAPTPAPVAGTSPPTGAIVVEIHSSNTKPVSYTHLTLPTILLV